MTKLLKTMIFLVGWSSAVSRAAGWDYYEKERSLASEASSFSEYTDSEDDASSTAPARSLDEFISVLRQTLVQRWYQAKDQFAPYHPKYFQAWASFTAKPKHERLQAAIAQLYLGLLGTEPDFSLLGEANRLRRELRRAYASEAINHVVSFSVLPHFYPISFTADEATKFWRAARPLCVTPGPQMHACIDYLTKFASIGHELTPAFVSMLMKDFFNALTVHPDAFWPVKIELQANRALYWASGETFRRMGIEPRQTTQSYKFKPLLAEKHPGLYAMVSQRLNEEEKAHVLASIDQLADPTTRVQFSLLMAMAGHISYQSVQDDVESYVAPSWAW